MATAIVKQEIQFGERKLVLETGRIARQANSVLASMGDTVVLVTAVAKTEADAGRDFFPLTVNYTEKAYAAGKIPGGFLKREGRPSEHETLICRLIDRPIRPLFPEGFQNEIQIIATVMSLDPEVSADVVAMIGASAALSISGAPFQGPIAAARVGYHDGMYLLNPTSTDLETSKLNLVVAGTENAILMVESEAEELAEDIMLGAVMYGHEMMQTVISGIKEFAAAVGTEAWDWQAPAINDQLFTQIKTLAEDKVTAAFQVQDKMQRNQALSEVRDAVISQLVPADEAAAENAVTEAEVRGLLSKLEKQIVRGRILSGTPRIDGRDTKTVRPITVEAGLLPRTHGSAVFTRGETQAIAATTLGSDRDAQIIDAIAGEYRDRFMLHYNFPPFCVGETGMVGSPKRREIGHGRLARRALEAVLPSEDEFPYVLRIVSEVTESNGSSSMATVCASTISMMDAGVPIKAPVAGVAMGLIKEGEQFAVLTDILGDEDHLGDMDFKVAGTNNGVTALQMDIKIDGITKDIMQQALDQALQARLHILDIMSGTLNAPREEMSTHAPRIETMKINPDKIRDVIGKGGATIRAITEETGVTIDISDDGVVRIFSPDGEASAAAIAQIESIVADIEVGKVYHGKVAKIVDFGAFVNLQPGKDGLLHISQISQERVNNVSDFLSEGQQINVRVLDVDRQGRIKLSMLDVAQRESEAEQTA